MIPGEVIPPIMLNQRRFQRIWCISQVPPQHPWQPIGPGMRYGLMPPMVYRPLGPPPRITIDRNGIDVEEVVPCRPLVIPAPEPDFEDNPLDLSVKKEEGRPLARRPNHVFGPRPPAILDLSVKNWQQLAPAPNPVLGSKRPRPEKDKEITVPIFFIDAKKWKPEVNKKKKAPLQKKKAKKEVKPGGHIKASPRSGPSHAAGFQPPPNVTVVPVQRPSHDFGVLPPF